MPNPSLALDLCSSFPLQRWAVPASPQHKTKLHETGTQSEAIRPSCPFRGKGLSQNRVSIANSRRVSRSRRYRIPPKSWVTHSNVAMPFCSILAPPSHPASQHPLHSLTHAAKEVQGYHNAYSTAETQAPQVRLETS